MRPISLFLTPARGPFRQRSAPISAGRGARNGSASEMKPNKTLPEMTMKTIASAILALSVLAGIAAPASAYDSGQDSHQRFFEQLQRNSG